MIIFTVRNMFFVASADSLTIGFSLAAGNILVSDKTAEIGNKISLLMNEMRWATLSNALHLIIRVTNQIFCSFSNVRVTRTAEQACLAG